jgi:hypothetical protein
MQRSRPFAEDLLAPECNSFLNTSSRLPYRDRVKAVLRLIFFVVASDKNPMQKPSEVVVEKFEYLP